VGETSQGTVLVVDDEKLMRWSVCQALANRGYAAREGKDAAEARALGPHSDAVVLDFRLPDADGFWLLEELVARAPRVPVIMMTAHGDVRHAVEAMRYGAWHYLPKPFELDEMCELVAAALGSRAVSEDTGDAPVPGLVVRSPAMQELARWIRLAAPSTATALLTGESGTGKNRIARAIHDAGPRCDRPFVQIACAAIPEALLESQLFGHEAGAFTGAGERQVGLIERADGGTVFFDQIGELSLAAQAKLLRFLEDGTIRRVGGVDEIRLDVRAVAATHDALETAVEDGRFRRDLYYRLRVLEARVPPLRERLEDIPCLAARALAELGHTDVRISPSAMRALSAHTWPGNVRELRNVLERASTLSDGKVLDASDLALVDLARDGDAGIYELPQTGLDLEAFEREMLRQALARTGNNRTRAAELLGLTRDAVRYRIAKYDGRP
jgi:DNA-binding NtrC family response regulator